MTDKLFEAFAIFEGKEPRHLGFLFCNTVTHLYYPELARQLFGLAVEIKKKLGISFRLYQSFWRYWCQRCQTEPNDIAVIGEGVRKVYEEVSHLQDLVQVKIFTRCGSFYVGTSTELWSQRVTHKKKHRINQVWMHQQSASCAQPCMEPTTMSPI